jgi:hypothetical protein
MPRLPVHVYVRDDAMTPSSRIIRQEGFTECVRTDSILRRDTTRLQPRSRQAFGHVVYKWLSRDCRASIIKALKRRAVTSPSKHFTSLDRVQSLPRRSKFGWGRKGEE